MDSADVGLSGAQRGVWFAQQLDPQSSVFSIGQVVWLPEGVDARRLARAVTVVLSETQVLWSRFVDGPDGPRQVVGDPLDDFECAVRAFDGPATELRQRAGARMADPIALSDTPLFDTTVWRLADGQVAWEFKAHHILVDAYAVSLLTRRLAQVYTAMKEDEPIPSAGFGTVAELVAAEDEYATSPQAEDDAVYWREYLSAHIPDDHDLVSTTPISDMPLEASLTLERSTADAIGDLAGRVGATWGEALIAVWSWYSALRRGRTAAPVAVPVMGRRGVGLRTPMMLVNILPLHLDVSPHESVGDWFARAAHELRQLRRHQQYRGEQLSLGAGGHKAALPQVNLKVFDYHLDFAGHRGVQETLAAGPVDDLDLFVYNDPVHGFVLDLRAHPDRHSVDDLQRHLTRLQSVLVELAHADVDDPVRSLATIGSGERRCVEVWSSGVVVDVPGDVTVDDLLRGAASVGGGRGALVSGDVVVSYREFDRQVSQLARHLLDVGVAVGDRVAVLARRDRYLPVALAAVLRAGGTYIPIDPDQPSDRIGYLLTDSAPVALVTNLSVDELSAGVVEFTVSGGGRLPVVSLVESATRAVVAGLDDSPVTDSDRGRRLCGQDGAYLIYTSGTTGRPKGIVVSHVAFAELIRRRQETFPVGAGERVFGKTSISFDPSQAEILWPLCVGATLDVLSDADAVDPAVLADRLNTTEQTYVQLTPSVLQEVLKHDPVGLAGVRYLTLIGEGVPAELAEQVYRRFGVRVWNTYGPAEATVEITWTQFDPEAPVTSRYMPIGRPIGNSGVLVLDSWLRPVPVGVPGELYLSGVQLARGYHDRSALTAVRFVAHPDQRGQRLYRTGDLARWNGHGQLEYLGRTDDQVKIRGQRVEPGEVAAILMSHPEVASAAVVPVSHPVTGLHLAAYYTVVGAVVGQESASVEDRFTPVLREWSGARLPAHMVPTTYLRMGQLPVTTNGKLDRRALPSIDPVGYAGRGRALASAAEHDVADVFARVLGLESVVELSADDDFFTLGGHSLLATRLIAVLNERHGTALTLRMVFDHPTIGGLGEVIDGGVGSDGVGAVLPRIGDIVRTDPVPASHGQQALWLIGQTTGPSTQYLTGDIVRLDPRVEPARVRAAVEAVLSRHEILRTRFVWNGDFLVQAIHTVDGATDLPYSEIRSASETVKDRALSALTQPRDGSEHWPISFTLVDAPDEKCLVVSAHHMVVDEASITVILSDLDTFLGTSAFATGDPIQFADWAVYERHVLEEKLATSSSSATAMDRVRASLDGSMTYPYLPYDVEDRTAYASVTVASVGRKVSDSLTRELKRFAAAHRASPLMLLNAALGAALTAMGAPDRAVFGTPASLRFDATTANSVGYYVNTVPVPVAAAPDVGFGVTVDAARDSMLTALENRDIPFDVLVQNVERLRIDNVSPVFQVMTAYAGVDDDPGLRYITPAPDLFELSSAGDRDAKFDLVVGLAEVNGEWVIATDYAAELFEAETVERLLALTVFFMVAGAQSADVAISTMARSAAASSLLRTDVRPEASPASVSTEHGAWHARRRVPLDGIHNVEDIRDAAAQVLGWTVREVDTSSSRLKNIAAVETPFHVCTSDNEQASDQTGAAQPTVICLSDDGRKSDTVLVDSTVSQDFDVEVVDVVASLLVEILNAPNSSGVEIALPDPGLAEQRRRHLGDSDAVLDNDFWMDFADDLDDATPTPLVGVASRPATDAPNGTATASLNVTSEKQSEPLRHVAVRAVLNALVDLGVLDRDGLVADGVLVDIEETARDGALTFALGSVRRRFPAHIRWTDESGALSDESDQALRIDGDVAEIYTVLRDHSSSAVGIFDDVPDAEVVVRLHESDAQAVPTGDAFEGEGSYRVGVDIVVGSSGGDGRSAAVLVAADHALGVTGPSLAARIADSMGEATTLGASHTRDPWEAGVLTVGGGEARLVDVDEHTALKLSRTFGRLDDILPVSPLQDGLLYHLLSAESSSSIDLYASQFVVDLRGRLDVSRLRDAATALLYQYPNLRAGFTVDRDRTLQVIPVDFDLPWHVYSRSDLTARGLESLLEAERTAPFHADSPPLVRFGLIERDADRWSLSIVFEHLLMDGWSTGLMLQSLFGLYGRVGNATTSPSDVPAATPAFRDYLSWLASRDVAGGLDAWLTELDGVDAPTLIKPEATAQAEAGNARDYTIELPRALADGVRRVAAGNDVTVSTVMYTAWGITLSKLVGSDDVMFGTTVSGRDPDLPDSDRVVGLLFNTVPVRVTLSPGQTIRSLLADQHTRQLNTMEHSYTALSELQGRLGLSTLFDTLFVVQNHDWAGGESSTMGERGEIDIADVRLDDSTHYPISFAFAPGDEFRLRCAYRGDLFSQQQIATLVDRLVSVVEAVVAEPSAPVSSLTVLNESDSTQLARWNVQEGDVPAETVAALFNRQVLESRGEIALVAKTVRLTFEMLGSRVYRFANTLVDRGVGPEHRVALLLPRDNRMVEAMFAVFDVGAAYVPIDSELPEARIRHILEDSRPTVVCTIGEYVERVPAEFLPAVLAVDDPRTRDEIEAAASSAVSLSARVPAPHLENLAYVIYTSGSTGRPKGVAVSYRGLTNMYYNHVEKIFDRVVEHQGGRRMRIAHTTSFSFDASWEQLFWLLAGHEVHVIDESLRKDPPALLAHYDAELIDGFDVTPSYGEVLVENGLLERDRPAGLSTAAQSPGVVFVSLGGEAVPAALWTALRDAPGVESYNLYGPTEYTINALGADLADSSSPSVGEPIFNTTAHVLDSFLNPTVPGTAGELYLSGEGIARGYFDRPDLTAAAFIADPWRTGQRMYRTGDVVRNRDDGSLEYLGRTDDQVKIRGFRIELGEIVNHLASHPEVSRAAVTAEDSDTGRRLVGFVVAAGDTAPGSDALREHVRRSLPEYMVPAAIAVVPDIPLTVNGKIDFTKLPKIGPSVADIVEPGTELEADLAAIFAAVLDMDSVSVAADFFDMGGNSLAVMRLIGRIDRDLDKAVSVQSVLDNPTVQRLAAEIEPDLGERASRTQRSRPTNHDEVVGILADTTFEDTSDVRRPAPTGDDGALPPADPEWIREFLDEGGDPETILEDVPRVGAVREVGDVPMREVTFGWRAKPGHEVMLHLTGYTDRHRGDTTPAMLEPVAPGSSVHVLSLLVPDDATVGYRYIERERVPRTVGSDLDDWRRLVHAAVPDPAQELRIPHHVSGSSSVLAMPSAPIHEAWPPDTVDGDEADRWITADVGDGRSARVLLAETAPRCVVVLFDGQHWERLPLAQVVGSHFPAVDVVAIDEVSSERRQRELTDGRYVESLMERALSAWRAERGESTVPVVVAGQSLGGLAAASLITYRPDLVDSAVVQSGSLWYRRDSAPSATEDTPGDLLTALAELPPSFLQDRRIVVQVGADEQPHMVEHSRLYVERARRLGALVDHREFRGTHDMAWWIPGLLIGLEKLAPR